jgi:hypothetical protein
MRAFYLGNRGGLSNVQDPAAVKAAGRLLHGAGETGRAGVQGAMGWVPSTCCTPMATTSTARR